MVKEITMIAIGFKQEMNNSYPSQTHSPNTIYSTPSDFVD